MKIPSDRTLGWVLVGLAIITAIICGVAAFLWLRPPSVRSNTPSGKTSKSSSTGRKLPATAHAPVEDVSPLPRPREHVPASDRASIFVSVAAFRDNLCDRTLHELFAKAAHPDRVFVGLFLQNEEGDPLCDGPPDRAAQIRRASVPASEAKGPNYARYRCSRLYGGEDYFMQIDSHSVLLQNWDICAIEELEKAQLQASKLGLDPKDAFLSHYPVALPSRDAREVPQNLVPYNCKAKWDRKNPWLIAQAVLRKPNPVPQPSVFVAAGMIFAPASFLHRVPFDPRITYVFHGEETLLCARTFTHGLTAFTPTKNLVGHWYTRKDEPKVWSTPVWKKKVKNNQTTLALIEGILTGKTADPHGLGLGTRRTISAFWEALAVKGPGIEYNGDRRVVNVCGAPGRMHKAVTTFTT
mgnify:CR=1 FL=1